MKKDTIDKLTIVVSVVALIVFIIKFDAIPAGIHYDQMRIVVDNQYITYGWITNLPWRQFVYYWLHGGPLISYMADLARFTGNFTLLSTIPKLITMSYFYLGVLVLDSILRELRFSVRQRAIFYMVFIPSAFTILLSKYIPHVASYFFFTLAATLIAMKIAQNAVLSMKQFSIWFLLLIFGACTHIIAIVAIVATSFYITVFSRQKWDRTKVAKLLLYLLLGALTYIASVYVGDTTLLGREILTIIQLLIKGEFMQAIQIALTTLSVYLSPSFIATGGFISAQGVVSTPYAWNMIKNPDMNQWVVNGLAPFGLIGILCYITPLFFNKQSKKIPSGIYQQNIFGIVLVLSFFSTAVIGIYDNPSWAKLAPLLIVVPYLVTFVLNELIQTSKAATIFAFVALSLNAIWNLYSMWGPMYEQKEVKKFDNSYEIVATYMSTRFNYAEDRIYLADSRWGFYTALEYYFGPSILDRVTPVTSPAELAKLLDSTERNWIITTESNYADLSQLQGHEKLSSSNGLIDLTLYAPRIAPRATGSISCTQATILAEKIANFETKRLNRLLSSPEVMNGVKYFDSIAKGTYVLTDWNNSYKTESTQIRNYGNRILSYNETNKYGEFIITMPYVTNTQIMTMTFSSLSRGAVSTMIEVQDRNTMKVLVGSRYILKDGEQSISWLQKPDYDVVFRIASNYTDPLIKFDPGKSGITLSNIVLSTAPYSKDVAIFKSNGIEFISTPTMLSSTLKDISEGTLICNIAYSPKIKVVGEESGQLKTRITNGGSLAITIPTRQSKVTLSVSLF